jgi:hypothetical protein
VSSDLVPRAASGRPLAIQDVGIDGRDRRRKAPAAGRHLLERVEDARPFLFVEPLVEMPIVEHVGPIDELSPTWVRMRRGASVNGGLRS